MSAALNSFTLLAIPFFILAAAVMNAGGITVRIVDLASHLVGHLRGGLGQANIVTNVLLAGRLRLVDRRCLGDRQAAGARRWRSAAMTGRFPAR